jgi:hypothetical protein
MSKGAEQVRDITPAFPRSPERKKCTSLFNEVWEHMKIFC